MHSHIYERRYLDYFYKKTTQIMFSFMYSFYNGKICYLEKAGWGDSVLRVTGANAFFFKKGFFFFLLLRWKDKQ